MNNKNLHIVWRSLNSASLTNQEDGIDPLTVVRLGAKRLSEEATSPRGSPERSKLLYAISKAIDEYDGLETKEWKEGTE